MTSGLLSSGVHLDCLLIQKVTRLWFAFTIRLCFRSTDFGLILEPSKLWYLEYLCWALVYLSSMCVCVCVFETKSAKNGSTLTNGTCVIIRSAYQNFFLNWYAKKITMTFWCQVWRVQMLFYFCLVFDYNSPWTEVTYDWWSID